MRSRWVIVVLSLCSGLLGYALNDGGARLDACQDEVRWWRDSVATTSAVGDGLVGRGSADGEDECLPE